PGGYRRQGPGLVALRPRVPGLACVARRRRPALCATSQVKPAEGSARQGHGRPSRPDPAGGSAPVTGLALRPAGAIPRVTLFLHLGTCCSLSPDCRAEPTSLSVLWWPSGPRGPTRSQQPQVLPAPRPRFPAATPIRAGTPGPARRPSGRPSAGAGTVGGRATGPAGGQTARGGLALQCRASGKRRQGSCALFGIQVCTALNPSESHDGQCPVTMKRLLDPDSLRALSRGCAVLGAGGGGDAYVTLLQALQATEDFGPVPLVDLDELPDDALIMPCAGIGATTV